MPVCIEIYIENKAKSAKTKGNYVNVEVIAALINGDTVERRSEPVFLQNIISQECLTPFKGENVRQTESELTD